MARRQTLDLIVKTFQELGGNLNDVLGTKTNISFLGKGKSPELMLDMDINPDALGVLPQSKAVEELTSSVGYALSNKLNDIQANKLLSNMQKMKDFYMPPAAPANITDLATRIRNLDKEGLMSLRAEEKLADDLVKNLSDAEIELRGRFPTASDVEIKRMLDKPSKEVMDILDAQGIDLPPPGSRGGPDDIAGPTFSDASTFTGKGLEAIKNVKGTNLIVDDLVDKIYLNAGVAPAAQPVVRANARDFLNRIKDLTDEPGNPTLSSVMEADDFKFMTEGGGGGMGDPLLLVQKYFGPKVATAVAKLDNADDIQLFAERLVSVKDARGRSVTDRFFDPDSVDISDFEFADGGRVPFFAGGAAAAGVRTGFQALRKYGFTGRDISRLFAGLGKDKSLVGEEKTGYFKQLNKVLKNPDDYPDAIKDLQKQLGIEVGIGFKGGGLAKILEV